MAFLPTPTPCLPPTRSRPDDQLVEMFLQVWQEGRFADSVDWLRPLTIATDAAGRRVALACARLFAPEPDPEALFQPITRRLAADPRLDQPGRKYDLEFVSPSLPGRLLGRFPEAVLEALAEWAPATLPSLPAGRMAHCTVPIPLPAGKTPRVAIDVYVLERAENVRPVRVTAYRPEDVRRLAVRVIEVLAAQIPPLVNTVADERVLLLAGPAAAQTIFASIQGVTRRAPLSPQIQHLVVADTRPLATEPSVVFSVANPESNGWSTILQPVFPVSSGVLARGGALASLTAQARTFAAAAKASNTLRAYQSDWNDFRQWCAAHQLPSLPAAPETVALYLTDRAATLKTSSLARRLTTISRAHQAAGHATPAAMQHAVVSEVWKGIQRKKGSAQEGKKPLLTVDLQQILGKLPDDLQGKRDRALLLTGFAGGFRRSELAALVVDHLEATPEGIVVRLMRSKTDPEGQGRPVALPYGSDPLTCPVRNLRAWLEAATITSGAVFRAVDQFGLVSESALHPDSIGWIVKRAAGRGGLEAMEYAGHSLRAGLATQAAMNGASELAIMKQTGHRSLTTVRKYIRDGALFRDNAATKLGL